MKYIVLGVTAFFGLWCAVIILLGDDAGHLFPLICAALVPVAAFIIFRVTNRDE